MKNANATETHEDCLSDEELADVVGGGAWDDIGFYAALGAIREGTRQLAKKIEEVRQPPPHAPE